MFIFKKRFSSALEIAQLGNPVLRQKAALVANVQDEAIQHLINQLIATAEKYKGVGIAAPQAGQSHRLLIIASYPSERYPHAPNMAPTPMINPSIIDHSKEIEKDWEGCLSIPGIRGLIPRYQSVEVEYLDRSGYGRKQILSGFIARIFQHEYDHLEGKVFLDRIANTQEIMTEFEYQKQIVRQDGTR
ncbi:MAG: peptide deformylase [SAR324 cluster bacterium]|nr:peptide deformylase [SAR324 cluster bacterium]